MLEFGIGLGWLGWECQNYLWTAGAGTAPVTPQCSCRAGEGNSCSRHSWEHPRAAAAHLQAAKTWGKVLQKVLFCPWFGFCALILALEHLGFPCPGSGHCSLISGLLFVQLGVEIGLERGSHKLWNLQNHFQHLKIKALPGLPARLHSATESGWGLPIPLPKASFPSRVFGVSVGFLVQPLVQFRVTSGCF